MTMRVQVFRLLIGGGEVECILGIVIRQFINRSDHCSVKSCILFIGLIIRISHHKYRSVIILRT